jgi:SNW domain-containing protein 1
MEALQMVVTKKIAAAQPKSLPKQPGAPVYINYTPQQQGAQYNSGAKQRIIKMQDMPIDPMEPPKFRHKKVPRPGGSPPVPIMHSPPRAVTVKDQQDWKIPPCISNWKNPKVQLATRLLHHPEPTPFSFRASSAHSFRSCRWHLGFGSFLRLVW